MLLCELFLLRDGIAYVDPRGDGRYIITNSKDQVTRCILCSITHPFSVPNHFEK